MLKVGSMFKSKIMFILNITLLTAILLISCAPAAANITPTKMPVSASTSTAGITKPDPKTSELLMPADGDLAIYLLSEDISAFGLEQIDIDQLALENEPIISSDDIVSYDKVDHIIELTQAAYARISQLQIKVDGIPFVVCVGSERIYTGGFWTPASSISFDGVVIMQPVDSKEMTIQITLGYPSASFFTGDDPRADPRIMEALEKRKSKLTSVFVAKNAAQHRQQPLQGPFAADNNPAVRKQPPASCGRFFCLSGSTNKERMSVS
jgi:hypothetical protein